MNPFKDGSPPFPTFPTLTNQMAASLLSSELLSSCDWFDDEQQSDEVVVFNAAAPANKTTAAENAAKAARRGVSKSKKRGALREGEAAPQWRKPLKQPKEVRGAGLYRSSQPEEEEEEADSPWKGLPVSNAFAVLASPEGRRSRRASLASSKAPTPAKAPTPTAAPSPPKEASPKPAAKAAKRASLVNAKSPLKPKAASEANEGTPLKRRTRAAVKMVQDVVSAVVQALSPSIAACSHVKALAARPRATRVSKLATSAVTAAVAAKPAAPITRRSSRLSTKA